MGGSFFHSDSSSSDSFTSDSETVTVAHDSPSTDGEDARGSHGGGTMLFVIFTFGLLVVGFCKNSNGNTITVLKLQVLVTFVNYVLAVLLEKMFTFVLFYLNHLNLLFFKRREREY